MKALRLLAAAAVLCTAELRADAPRAPRAVGVCAGADPCKVCSDCSRCRFCDPKNPKGGSCGVVRAQDGKAAAERERKRARTR